jgi:hypothetical protein
LRNDGDCRPEAILNNTSNILAIDEDTAALYIIKALEQSEQSRFAATGFTDQSDTLIRFDSKAECLENAASTKITERDIVEFDRRATLNKRTSLRVIPQLVLGQ